MRPNDIENWALQVIDRVKSGQPIEDSRVELKSRWPEDHHRAARQIAGHANAAKGEPVLWLIGVDEKEGLKGVEYEEISNWASSVKANFEGLAPPVTHLNIPYDGHTVAALLWETERRPFLVKNALHGKQKGDVISWEVPWRETTKTRTAKRTDLLKMLVPLCKKPSFEVLGGKFDIAKSVHNNYGSPIGDEGLKLTAYVVPGDTGRIVIPWHRCEAFVRSLDSEFRMDMEHVYLRAHSKSQTIVSTHDEIIIDGPGMICLYGGPTLVDKANMAHGEGDVEATFKVRPVGANEPVVIVGKLTRTKTRVSEILASWHLIKTPDYDS